MDGFNRRVRIKKKLIKLEGILTESTQNGTYREKIITKKNKQKEKSISQQGEDLGEKTNTSILPKLIFMVNLTYFFCD